MVGIFADEGISGTLVPMKIGIKLFIQNIRNIYHIISQVECKIQALLFAVLFFMPSRHWSNQK